MTPDIRDEQASAVECGACGWKGRRKPGDCVWCPKCGALAAFQPDGEEG